MVPYTADRALGWVLKEPKVGVFLNLQPPFLIVPPDLLKRGDWTLWSHPRAYVA